MEVRKQYAEEKNICRSQIRNPSKRYFKEYVRRKETRIYLKYFNAGCVRLPRIKQNRLTVYIYHGPRRSTTLVTDDHAGDIRPWALAKNQRSSVHLEKATALVHVPTRMVLTSIRNMIIRNNVDDVGDD